MKEPLLQDKRSEHVRFCRYAAELTERVSGKPLLMGSDVSLARLQRANVVAQSRITFSQKELLVLIRNHLVAKGLHDTANTLVREANLPSSPPLICRSHRSDRQGRIGGGHVGSSPASSLAVASSSSTPIRSLVLSSPSPASLLSGRILFSRERPPAICNSGRRLRALKQKSDHGAFIQVREA
ncbi:protein VPRBP-like, partial [Notothenia coriiceps]|uniref:Protein VPRBP-like n=1 Tax=Notothenia coriiceps TaxID=8208 RepID=A0A6I9PAX4_9TELE